MNSQQTLRMLVCLAAGLLVTGGTLWAEQPPSLDELLKIVDRPATGRPDGPDPMLIDPDVRERLEDDAAAAADAFRQALGQMDQVAVRLGDHQDPGLITQRIEESIIAKLDQALDAARRQSGGQSRPSSQRQQDTGAQQNQPGPPKQGSSGSNPSGTMPNQGSPTSGAPAAHDAGGEIEETRDQWGSLPDRVRQELLQGIGSKYSSVYRRLTEAYYKRLAQESSGE